jgi:HPt (histidine-containing phosphotransfer) domain-containing protein
MMMDEFEKTIPEFMTRLENALGQNDMQSLGRDAHQFKGAAANLGAKAIAAIALELEKIGKSGDGNGAEEALSGLKAEVDKFNQKLSEIDWSAL